MCKMILLSENKQTVSEFQNLFQEIYIAETADECIEMLKNQNLFPIIIVETPSEKMGFKRLVDYVEQHNSYVEATAILILTDLMHVSLDSRYIGGAVVDFIEKPLNRIVIQNRIRNAMKIVNDISFDDFAEMLKVLPANIYLKDATGKYIFSSQTWQHLDTGGDPNWTIRGKTDLEIRKDKENALLAMESDKKLIASGKGTSYIIREDSNGQEYLQLIKEPLFDENGKVKGIIALINNVTEQELMRQKLKERSIHDTLTGLYNRTYLDEYLMEVRREKQYPISIISADCDNLKRVNDTYGHMSGDKYLCKSTELMQSVFPPKACMFRTGGDEFVIFLPHTSEEETEELIEKLQQNEEEFFCSKTKTFPVSLSVGYAVVHDETDSVIEAMKLSDSEMYKNKRKRKISRGG